MRRVLGIAVVTVWMVVLAGTGWADMGKTAPALKAAPGSKAEAHLKEGIEHYDQGHFDVALKHFMAGAKEDPQSAEAHYFAGVAFAARKQLKDGLEQMREATRINERFHDAYYMQATLEAMLDETATALVSLCKAIEGDPRYHEPLVVNSLYAKLGEAWQQATALESVAEDDWYRIEIENVLWVFRHAAEHGECVVSVLQAPTDEERANRVRIPFATP